MLVRTPTLDDLGHQPWTKIVRFGVTLRQAHRPS